jgi:NNP family nitrate/nitrite transporter-like MFS transporter
MTDNARATVVRTAKSVAFAVCFACWMMNAVLITFLTTNGIFDWNASQVGTLLATPVLTGALLRLPVGILADRFGGRTVYALLMLLAAGALFANSLANSYAGFLAAALGFGLAGASFAVGVAYTSIWFPKERQGTALGIFGMGNAGTALTLMFAPTLLQRFTHGGEQMDNWRMLPRTYAAILAITAVIFWLVTYTRKLEGPPKSLSQRLAPLGQLRVWRFGAYYALLFGGFVALSNWLVPYYVKAYGLKLTTAGFFATIFSLPSGLFRAVGGWLSDRFGARSVMNWVLGACCLISFALFFPKMDIITPGEGILAKGPGVVESVTDKQLVVRQAKTGKLQTYTLSGTRRMSTEPGSKTPEPRFSLVPNSESWQEWAGKPNGEGLSETPFQPGDKIVMRQLLARGSTHIYFQANVYVFTFLVLLLGMSMGIGMAAVYKHIPTYFPADVGAVGGLVGVIGGLGGFAFPLVFGWLLSKTGVWTSCWVFLFLFALGCLLWMRVVIRRIILHRAPELLNQFERHSAAG